MKSLKYCNSIPRILFVKRRIANLEKAPYICQKQIIMKQTTFILASLTLVFGLGLSSCKKKGCTDSTATNYNSSANKDDGSCTFDTGGTATAPQPFTPNFSGQYAALIAVKTITTTSTVIGPVDFEAGTAVAAFSTNSGVSYVGAGTVSANSNNLTQQSNNSYVYLINQSNASGISFSSNVDWAGSGGTWNSFSTNTTQGFSTIPNFTVGTVSTGSSYTLTSGSVANADSILYGVYGPDGSKTIIVGGATTSHTFSAAEMSTIGHGTGYVQVVGINYDQQVIGIQDYWLLNETVRTKQVTITQ